MRVAILAIVALSTVSPGAGQHRLDPAARASGGVWLREGGDPWLTLGAAPLLSGVRVLRVGIASFPAPWGLPELSGYAAALALPVGPGTLGLSLTRTGFELLSETTLSLAFGGRAGIVLYGITVRYRALRIERYGSALIPGADAAVVIETGGWFRWGLRITDINRAPVGRTGERVRERASLAVNIGPPGGPTLSMQLEHDPLGSLSAGAGCSYGSGDVVAVMLGASGAFDRIHCGFELNPGAVSVGYGVIVHPEIGWSHSLWLGFGGAP